MTAKVPRTAEVLVFAESMGRRLAPVSLELLGKGRELADALQGVLAAVLIGKEVGELAGELVACGAERVYLVEEASLELYQSGAYADVLADLIRERSPEIVLVGATSIGRDLAARVAARVGTGLTAHCIDLYIEEAEGGQPRLAHIVPGWGGNLALKIVCPKHRPQMATARPGVFERPARDERREGEIVSIVPRLREESFRARTVALVEQEEEGVPLERAERVVAGGWGLHSVGGIQPARELAELLGAALAGTRPVIDKGWLPEARMIGQSGKTVRPKLFISLGASGAMHFTTGFSRARVVFAVDQNRQAPIFEVCDLGIVGDLRQILPRLLEEIRATQERGTP